MSADHPLHDEFIAAEQQAALAGVGMWSGSCGAATSNDVAVIQVEPDPQGPDEDDLNGEYVMIDNRGASTADLTGWVLRDESSVNRYLFPSGFTLPPSETVTIHTGCGTDTATDLYWCAPGPVWNNDGDTAMLLDASGNPASRLRFIND